MIIATHGIIASQLAGFDADAQAFFDRVTTAGGTLSATEKTAVNQLVLDLKSYSIWSKMKAIYPMVGASSAACAQNLKSSSFTGTFSGGWTYSSTGVTPNGSTGYMNTGLNDSTQLSLNNLHIAVYLRTNSDGTRSDIGVYNNSNSGINMFTRLSNQQYTRLHDDDANTISTTDSRGFRLGIRNTSSAKNVFINNVKSSFTQNSVSLTNANIYIGATNDIVTGASYYSNRENAYASIGDGLTDTEASNLYTAVNAFQVSLSRNI